MFLIQSVGTHQPRPSLHSLTIPRGQVVLASGPAAPDATEFEVTATLGGGSTGIVSGLVRPGSPRKPAGGTSTGSSVDENAPTLIDPP